MSNDTAQHGPALYAYLADYWRTNGTNQNAWCDQHPGIHAPTVSRWRNGTEPRLSAFRAVADALGVSILDVLQAAGVITAAEAKGRTVAPHAAPSLDVALERDETVPASARRAIAEMLRAIRDVESGKAAQVTASPRGRRTRGK
ncbi:MAG TPA: helix-turn-helix transcriptional regulator [Jatrophihabitans sp.]|nr:helix-turn-helix transcriptional regulator [Jatrophihabitans sp.]